MRSTHLFIHFYPKCAESVDSRQVYHHEIYITSNTSDLIDKTDISTKATETSGVGVEGWRENEDDGTGGDGGDGDWSLSKKETRRIAKLSKRIQREKDNEINSLQRSFDTIIL